MSDDSKKENESYDSFQVGDRVRHPKFGEGQVIQRSGSGDQTKLVVTFAEEGEKKLMARYANLKRLHPIASEEQKAVEVKPKPAPAAPRKRTADTDDEEADEAAMEGGDDFEAVEEAEEDEDFEFEDDEEEDPMEDEAEEKE
jgi:hypothetical protein